eukprot:tig00021127_g18686.t1
MGNTQVTQRLENDVHADDLVLPKLAGELLVRLHDEILPAWTRYYVQLRGRKLTAQSSAPGAHSSHATRIYLLFDLLSAERIRLIGKRKFVVVCSAPGCGRQEIGLLAPSSRERDWWVSGLVAWRRFYVHLGSDASAGAEEEGADFYLHELRLEGSAAGAAALERQITAASPPGSPTSPSAARPAPPPPLRPAPEAPQTGWRPSRRSSSPARPSRGRRKSLEALATQEGILRCLAAFRANPHAVEAAVGAHGGGGRALRGAALALASRSVLDALDFSRFGRVLAALAHAEDFGLRVEALALLAALLRAPRAAPSATPSAPSSPPPAPPRPPRARSPSPPVPLELRVRAGRAQALRLGAHAGDLEPLLDLVDEAAIPLGSAGGGAPGSAAGGLRRRRRRRAPGALSAAGTAGALTWRALAVYLEGTVANGPRPPAPPRPRLRPRLRRRPRSRRPPRPPVRLLPPQKPRGGGQAETAPAPATRPVSIGSRWDLPRPSRASDAGPAQRERRPPPAGGEGAPGREPGRGLRGVRGEEDGFVMVGGPSFAPPGGPPPPAPRPGRPAPRGPGPISPAQHPAIFRYALGPGEREEGAAPQSPRGRSSWLSWLPFGKARPGAPRRPGPAPPRPAPAARPAAPAAEAAALGSAPPAAEFGEAADQEKEAAALGIEEGAVQVAAEAAPAREQSPQGREAASPSPAAQGRPARRTADAACQTAFRGRPRPPRRRGRRGRGRGAGRPRRFGPAAEAARAALGSAADDAEPAAGAAVPPAPLTFRPPANPLSGGPAPPPRPRRPARARRRPRRPLRGRPAAGGALPPPSGGPPPPPRRHQGRAGSRRPAPAPGALGPGGIPPPPPPPGCGPMLIPAPLQWKGPRPAVPTKTFFWSPIPQRALAGTVKELEALFCARPAPSAADRAAAAAAAAAAQPKVLRVLDIKRANNVGAPASPGPPAPSAPSPPRRGRDLAVAVRGPGPVGAGPHPPLPRPSSSSSSLLPQLSGVRELAGRLDAAALAAAAAERAPALAREAGVVAAAARELQESESVRRILELALLTGNVMNSTAPARGVALGFRLDFLPKLADVRGADGRTTALQFLVATAVRRFPAPLRSPLHQCPSLDPASRVLLAEAAAEAEALWARLEAAEALAGRLPGGDPARPRLEGALPAVRAALEEARAALRDAEAACATCGGGGARGPADPLRLLYAFLYPFTQAAQAAAAPPAPKRPRRATAARHEREREHAREP